jgi:hypothetical protein
LIDLGPCSQFLQDLGRLAVSLPAFLLVTRLRGVSKLGRARAEKTSTVPMLAIILCAFLCLLGGINYVLDLVPPITAAFAQGLRSTALPVVKPIRALLRKMERGPNLPGVIPMAAATSLS